MGTDRQTNGRQKSSKKMQLTCLLNAVGTANSRKPSVDVTPKLGPKLAPSKSKILVENKSFVS